MEENLHWPLGSTKHIEYCNWNNSIDAECQIQL